jgi:hypothetical protein
LFFEICGAENVLVSQEPFRFSPGDSLSINVTEMFSTDSPDQFCGVVSLTLVNDTGVEIQPDPEKAALVTFADGVLDINPDSTFFQFAIMATTQGGRKAWRKFIVSIDQCGSQVVTPVVQNVTRLITKNSGQQTLLTAAEIEAGFETELVDICPVTSFSFDFPFVQPGLPRAFLSGDDGNVYVSTSLPSDDLMEFKWEAVEVTASTDYFRNGTFDVIAHVGCFFETSIAKNIEPFNQAYDIAVALPYEANAQAADAIFKIDIPIRLF